MANTKSPSGLTIVRNGLKFTFGWKITDSDYGEGQQLQWRIFTGKWSAWTAIAIGTAATQAVRVFSADNYWPKTKVFFYGIQFRVRGKRKKTSKTEKGNTVTTTYDWSGWTTKTWDLTAPETPSLTAELDDTHNNVCKFTWSTPNVSDTNDKPFYDVEWQSVLVKESNETDGSKLKWNANQLGWKTGKGANASAITLTEDTLLLGQNSYTRWVRVRSRGCGGNGAIKGCSYWRYAKHVYARPYLPVVNSAKMENNRTWLRMFWTAGQCAAHPIDVSSAEWAIDKPAAGRKAPINTGWEEAASFRDTAGKDEAFFQMPELPGIDECLWVRVSVLHDRNWRSSGEYLVMSGALQDPSDLTVSANESTFRAIITAQNNSEVPDSQLAVVFRRTGEKDIVIGIIPHNESSVTVQCPDWSTAAAVSFGVYAFQGSATAKNGKDGVKTYTVEKNMYSQTVWKGGTVPVEPKNVTASQSETQGEVILSWDWTWTKANRAEISWSQNPNAWESTDEPESYMISSLNAPSWRVSGLETGVTWYFRVRLAQQNGEEITYGPYCDPVGVDLSSAPVVPSLTLSSASIARGDTFTASWTYISTDGTPQSYAELGEAEISEDSFSVEFAFMSVGAEHSTELHVFDNWLEGETHYICVRTASESGKVSEWSNPVGIKIAEPIECSITQTSLEVISVGSEETERTVTALTHLPIEVTVEGAGEGGTTSVVIERAADYHMLRPDGSERDGFKGETIAVFSQLGEDPITIWPDNLTGLLDDGAAYRLIAKTEDGLGQSAEAEIEFEIHWTHQAGIPGVDVETIGMISKIIPIAPAEYEEGDVCDIYRLSADLPELIIEGGTFGAVYADPYPAIGKGYGHRIVHRTINGDYITASDQPAWIDTDEYESDQLDEYGIIIDFAGKQVILPYDVTLSNRWKKDFKRTSYLGGTQEGDWNPAVERTATYTVNLIAGDDDEEIKQMRELAAHPGICHIRTPEGSSYAADIEVSESKGFSDWETVSYTLTVTRVDPEEPEGILYRELVNG